MAKKTHKVEFQAHKTVKKPTNVNFNTKSGEQVSFKAKKPTKVPVDVSFNAKNK